MSTRQSSLAPTVLAIFLVPVAIPVIFAMLATPWSERVTAQEQALRPKRSELPPDRPHSAPIRAGAFPRKAVVNRRSDKSGETDRNGIPQRPSPKVAILNGQTPNRSPSPPLQSRSTNSTARLPIPQKLPRIQQASREAAPSESIPSPNDFVGTEQRTQELNRKLDADIAKNLPNIQRSLKKQLPVVDDEEPKPDETPSAIESPGESVAKLEQQPEVSHSFDPLDPEPMSVVEDNVSEPQVTVSSDEMIPSPEDLSMDDAAEGVTNAYFEEPAMEEPGNDEEVLFDVPQQMLANDSNSVDDADWSELNTPFEVNEPAAEYSSDLTLSDNTKEPTEVAVQQNELPASVPEPAPIKTIPKWFSDLRAINSIDLREATQVPPVAPSENSAKILHPQDQANEFLAQRQAVNFSTAYWQPWRADRDSYPFCHYPLYFEDPNLERCGRGWGLGTTFVSLGRFYANVPFIPYRVTAEPHLRRVPTLPDCPSCNKFGVEAYLPPWSWKAAAVQTGAYFGAIYIFP